MLELIVCKGDMFKDLGSKKGKILLHSCNGKGRWGSGIALLFHKKFPQIYLKYHNNANKLGTGYVIEDGDYRIGCLVTSKGYGGEVDPPRQIAENTYLAIKSLLETLPEGEVTIHSPKINAGLFKTPWQWTKKAIVKACNESDKKITWIVWEL